MSQSLIPVSVVVADRNYRLKIDPADEEVVRKTIKTINEKIIEYKTDFAGEDMQDYVSMVLLWLSTEQQKPDAMTNFSTNEKDKLNKLEALLDKALQAGD